MVSSERNMIRKAYYGGCTFEVDLGDNEACAYFEFTDGTIKAVIPKDEIPILIKHLMENND